jgi:aminocarboxymuconate-semialdehyde decarboxylase
MRAALGFACASVAAPAAVEAADQPSLGADVRSAPVVDMHAHFFPQSFLDILKAAGEGIGGDYWWTPQGVYVKAGALRSGPADRKIIDLNLRLADMDRQGVKVHALSLTNPMPYFTDTALSVQLAAAFNDAVSKAHQEYPTRFVGFATLPMLDPDHSIDELDRAARLPGIRGVYLGTNIAGRDLSDPMFRPVFARIEALGLPVFLHPGNTLGGDRLTPYYLSNLLGNPFDTAAAAAHLIFGGVLDRFPLLQVNLPHAGGAFPVLAGRLDRGVVVRPELKGVAYPPTEYLRRFTYDTISHSEPTLRFLISLVGIDRIMMGSDFCLDVGYERPVEIVDQLGLAAAERNLVLGGTAAKILRL